MLTRGYVGAQSAGASAAVPVTGEEPAGAVNGTNTVYSTLSKFLAGSEALYLNGVRQRFGASNDYTRSESIPTAGFDQVVFTLAPRAGDVILIDYFMQ